VVWTCETRHMSDSAWIALELASRFCCHPSPADFIKWSDCRQGALVFAVRSLQEWQNSDTRFL